ncbi:MAG: PIG-L family deacetylase [Leptospiraceae bacterium]|nr:PIG-L family deacetylase [Leptospiraceae bacterium]
MKIVCIGAHPDDVELAMGGTVALLTNLGHEVTILDLSNGEPTPCGDVETRAMESSQAAKLLGVKRITLDNPNRFIFDTIEARKKLATVFRELRPELIFTHYEFDFHPDHVESSALTEAGRFYSKLSKSDIEGEPFFPEKILYYFPNHVYLNLHPSFLVNISEFIETKEKVMNCYHSQFIKKGNGIMIKNCIDVNRYYGIRIGADYAEPFYSKTSVDICYFSNLFTKKV